MCGFVVFPPPRDVEVMKIWFSRKTSISPWSDDILFIRNRYPSIAPEQTQWRRLLVLNKGLLLLLLHLLCEYARPGPQMNEYVAGPGKETSPITLSWKGNHLADYFTHSFILGTIFRVLPSKSTIELDHNKAKTIENTPFRIFISTIKCTVPGGLSTWSYQVGHHRKRGLSAS